MLRQTTLATLTVVTLLSSWGTAQSPPAFVAAEPTVLEGSAARVLALAISPDGKLLASGGYDHPEDDSPRKTVRIWNLETNKQLQAIPIEADDVNTLAFDPGSARVAVGHRNGKVSCWSAETGKQLFISPESDAEVKGVAFSRDGKQVISGSDKFRAWDAATGKPLGEVNTHNDWGINCLALSQDGAVLTAGCGSEGIVINTATMRPLQVLRGLESSVDAIALSASKRYVATGANDGSITIWEAPTGKKRLTMKGHTDAVACLAFVDRDRRVVSGGHDGKLKVWSLPSGKQEQEIEASTLAVDALAVARDGRTLVHNDILRIHVRSLGGERASR